jgi:replicative DNA helicase
VIADISASERAFIGSLLNDPQQYWGLRTFVRLEMLENEEHRKIYEAVSNLMEAGRVVTKPALDSALPEEYGDGKPYVALWMSLKASGAEAGPAVDYGEAIRDRYTRKRIRRLGETAMKLERDPDKTPDDILSEIEALVLNAVHDNEAENIKWLGDAAKDSLARTAENFRVKGELQIGLTTGIRELDHLIGPIMGGDLVTLAAPSGHGKSTIAVQILLHQEKPSFLISQEMMGVQIARRVMSSWTQVSAREQRAGDIDVFQYNALKEAAGRAGEVKLLMDESGRQTTSRICKKIRAMHRRYGLGCAAIDHILLVKPDNPRWAKIETIEHAAMSFKELAKELDIPIFLLAQLTRGSQDKATSWKFTDQALYGGDAIKQASDVMLGITLPRKWLRQREPEESDQKAHDAWAGKMERWQDKAEIGALKMRDDDDGHWLTLPFDGATYTFGTRSPS